jgi:alpha-1,4-digalacturonate transport system permease protein
VAIRSLVGAENINWTILIAASVISILPLLLVFLAFQRWILDSNLDSGLK